MLEGEFFSFFANHESSPPTSPFESLGPLSWSPDVQLGGKILQLNTRFFDAALVRDLYPRVRWRIINVKG